MERGNHGVHPHAEYRGLYASIVACTWLNTVSYMHEHTRATPVHLAHWHGNRPADTMHDTPTTCRNTGAIATNHYSYQHTHGHSDTTYHLLPDP